MRRFAMVAAFALAATLWIDLPARAHEEPVCAFDHDTLGYYYCGGIIAVGDDATAEAAPDNAAYIEAQLARDDGGFEPFMIYDAESERAPIVPCRVAEALHLRWRYLNEQTVPVSAWSLQSAYCVRPPR